jgi:hypothetical protein
MLRADYELTIPKVQLLSSRDALAAFFARLQQSSTLWTLSPAQ